MSNTQHDRTELSFMHVDVQCTRLFVSSLRSSHTLTITPTKPNPKTRKKTKNARMCSGRWSCTFSSCPGKGS